jgi:hypothetical protein
VGATEQLVRTLVRGPWLGKTVRGVNRGEEVQNQLVRFSIGQIAEFASVANAIGESRSLLIKCSGQAIHGDVRVATSVPRDIGEHIVMTNVEFGDFACGNPACAVTDAGLPIRTIVSESPALTGAEVALLLLCGVSMTFLKPMLSRSRTSALTMTILTGLARFPVAALHFWVSRLVGGSSGPVAQSSDQSFSQGITRAGSLHFGAD